MLTIAYITSRLEPQLHWFLDSLRRQAGSELIHLIIVDFFADDQARRKDTLLKLAQAGPNISFTLTSPKPTVWAGPHRLTKTDFWAKSNALNSTIILCRTEWLATVDDRSVLAPGWLDAVKAAMAGGYAVCGSYEKHAHLQVEDGLVTGGELLGADTRTPGVYPFASWYGGSGALPLEWCLAVNGYDEQLCESVGSEDSMFGVCLRNSGFPVKYNSGMRIIEDRTPGQIDGALKRADKGMGRMAKSWDIVRAFHGKKTSQNNFDLRNIRDRVLLNHEPLESIGPFGSDRDFYDGQLLSEME